jgi:hypothetical protein
MYVCVLVYVSIYIYLFIYFTAIPNKERKVTGAKARGHENGDWPASSPRN